MALIIMSPKARNRREQGHDLFHHIMSQPDYIWKQKENVELIPSDYEYFHI